MLETCRGGPRPIRLCVENYKKFWSNSTTADVEAKMEPNFDRPVFPKFQALSVEDLPYMLETCRGGIRPIRLCVEKTKNFVKFNHRGPVGQNGPKF